MKGLWQKRNEEIELKGWKRKDWNRAASERWTRRGLRETRNEKRRRQGWKEKTRVAKTRKEVGTHSVRKRKKRRERKRGDITTRMKNAEGTKADPVWMTMEKKGNTIEDWSLKNQEHFHQKYVFVISAVSEWPPSTALVGESQCWIRLKHSQQKPSRSSGKSSLPNEMETFLSQRGSFLHTKNS